MARRSESAVKAEGRPGRRSDQPPGAGGSVAAPREALTAGASRRSRRPYQETAAPTTSSAAQISIARWKASSDAWFEAAVAAGLAPAAGGLSGWKVWRTFGSPVSSPAAEPSDE